MAAFTSASKRSKDAEINFRATYNLGNTAFTVGDFQSALAYYQQALLYNPESEDARYNLELTLRELSKQAKEDPGQQSRQQPGSSDQPGGNENRKKENQQKAESNRQAKPEEPADEESSPGQAEKDPNESSEKGKHDQGKDSGSDQSQQITEKSPQDLSGQLSPLQALPAQQEEGQDADSTMSMIDKKKAESLLDNIKEDRSRFLQFQVPQEKRRGVRSRKDW
jgi:Ca-activated chloride channel family protein